MAYNDYILMEPTAIISGVSFILFGCTLGVFIRGELADGAAAISCVVGALLVLVGLIL